MSALLHIAIDAMSGDHGPSVCVPAAVAAAHEFSDVRFTLIGRQPELERKLGGAFPSNVSCLHAADVVEMTDHPREALRRKKDSSMRRAIDLVKANDAHACVSAGNTGALMATAHFVLKMLPGVERPAIVSVIPSRGGHTYMLDLGANASCTPVQLSQFAVMGSVLAADLEGAHARPRVGLLNIGTEEIKGNDIVQQAHDLLAAGDINYFRILISEINSQVEPECPRPDQRCQFHVQFNSLVIDFSGVGKITGSARGIGDRDRHVSRGAGGRRP